MISFSDLLLDDQDDDPTKRQRLLPMDFDETPANAFDDALSPLPATFLQYMVYLFAERFDINVNESITLDRNTGITSFNDVEDIYNFTTWYLEYGEDYLMHWKQQDTNSQEEENTWSFITGAQSVDQLKKSPTFYILLVMIFQSSLPPEEKPDALKELTSFDTLQRLIDEVRERRAALETDDDVGLPYASQLGNWLSTVEDDDKTVLDILMERWKLMKNVGTILPSQIFQKRPDVMEEEEHGDANQIPQDFTDFINQGTCFFYFSKIDFFWKESTKVKRIQPPRSKVKEPSEQVETWISVRFDPSITVISRERLFALSFCHSSFLIKSSSP